MLLWLHGSVRPDISMSVRQCARFCNEPKLYHERAIHNIVKYLIGNSSKCIINKLDKDKEIEYFVYADFAGAWESADPSNPEHIMSRTGCNIVYAGCAVLWVSWI